MLVLKRVQYKEQVWYEVEEATMGKTHDTVQQSRRDTRPTLPRETSERDSV